VGVTSNDSVKFFEIFCGKNYGMYKRDGLKDELGEYVILSKNILLRFSQNGILICILSVIN